MSKSFRECLEKKGNIRDAIRCFLRGPPEEDIDPPQKPTSFKVKADVLRARLSWDEMKKAEYYNIYHARVDPDEEVPEGEFSLLESVDAIKFDHDDLDPGWHYYYVTAVGEGGESEPTHERKAVIRKEKPKKVTGLELRIVDDPSKIDELEPQTIGIRRLLSPGRLQRLLGDIGLPVEEYKIIAEWDQNPRGDRVKQYHIYGSEDGENYRHIGRTTETKFTQTTHMIPDYIAVYVTAENIHGEGPPSDEVEIKGGEQLY